LSKHNFLVETRQRIWHALRITPHSTRKELCLIADAHPSTVRKILHEWVDMGLVKAIPAKSNQRRGRPPLIYSVLDKNIVIAPVKPKC
jgi:predicted ArsR family transcriptional regulator